MIMIRYCWWTLWVLAIAITKSDVHAIEKSPTSDIGDVGGDIVAQEEQEIIAMYKTTRLEYENATDYGTETLNACHAWNLNKGKVFGECFGEEIQGTQKRVAILFRGEAFRHTAHQHEHKKCTPDRCASTSPVLYSAGPLPPFPSSV